MPPKDCVDIQRYGHNVSGVYEVYLDQARKFVNVYCDLESDNGGWLVFQRRQDGSVDFYRNWADYKAGFGDLTGEFWLGNDLLHAVTSQRHYTLRIDLEDFEGASRFAVYQNFAVSSESDNFRVSFGAYSGNAVETLSFHRVLEAGDRRQYTRVDVVFQAVFRRVSLNRLSVDCGTTPRRQSGESAGF
ncbi:hypothetical protein NP493_1282g00003 [Ridgeia piscesae]|uniref:Fibrinogen C-terminal domain-containing protein n=1 Tax=Ridgeia piscesae TaxID=27915 RepID=A0AAD9KA03_RIDPI|nr:hypothetical protein NP493_1282g00003 [Ridgeia piscesae]